MADFGPPVKTGFDPQRPLEAQITLLSHVVRRACARATAVAEQELHAVPNPGIKAISLDCRRPRHLLSRVISLWLATVLLNAE